ncbi:ankyrin [Neocallimastix sp. 'constans']
MNEKEIIKNIENIIKNTNSRDELKNFIEENNIKDLTNLIDNYNLYRSLVNGIEGKISLDILECIHLHGKYDIYNNIFLSAAIKCNNFNVANYIQEKGEETVNALSYDSLLDDINTKSYQYMLNNGLYITSNLVQEIIKHNKFKFLNQIFKFIYFDNDFILLLLSYYNDKNKVSISQWNEIFEKEKKKTSFNEKMYEIAINGNQIEIINILYRYDSREHDVIIQNFSNIFNRNKNIKDIFINKLKNVKSKVSVDQKLIRCLEQITTKYEVKEKIGRYIKDNNKRELEQYIRKNNIQLFEYRDGFNKKENLLEFAIKNGVSMDIIYFIIKTCSYDISKIKFDSFGEDEGHSILYLILSKNHFKLLDFLIRHGMDISNKDVLSWLYEDHLLNNKKLYTILNYDFCIKCSTINQLIIHHQINIMEKIFRYYRFNNAFILKLLSIYKNKMGLTDIQLRSIIFREKNKLKFNKSMYEKAIDNDDYEMISYLYQNDTRNHEIILKEIFQLYDKDDRIFHHGKKVHFIDKVKNGELSFSVDSFYLNHLMHSEEIRKIIIEKVNMDNVSEIKMYLQKNNIDLNYFNDSQFDILIHAIKMELSYSMIKFIVSHYSSFDYTVHPIGAQDYISPLSCALAHKNYAIAQLLLNHGADINFNIYNTAILDKFYQEEILDKKILKLLLNNGITVTSKFMIDLVEDKKYDFLEIIKNNLIFNNAFIINLLSIYNHKVFLSKKQLKDLIMKEESKINISKDWFKKIMSNEYRNIMEMFYHYRRCEREEDLKLDSEELNSLINYCIINDDYNLVHKIFNNLSFDSEHYDLEENIFYHYDLYSSFYDRITHHLDIVQLIVKLTFRCSSFNLNNIKFYEKMKEIELDTEDIFSFFKFYIQQWLSHPSFNFENIDFEKILLSLGFEKMTNIILEEKTILLMKCFFEESLKHSTFDFHRISFENILDCFRYQIKLYCQSFCQKVEHFIILQLIIEKAVDHKTFDLQAMDFEEILTVLNDISCRASGDNPENAIDLMKFSFEKIIHHPTFDINFINIKKDILILILNRYSTSNIRNFLNEIFNSPSFSNANNKFLEDILLTVARTEDIELIEFVMYKLYSREFNESIKSNDIKNFLLTASRIENTKITKFVIEKFFRHSSFELNENILENALLAVCKFDSLLHIEYIMECIYSRRGGTFDLCNFSPMSIEKILKKAIQYNNVNFINYTFQKLLSKMNINEKIHLIETLLLYSSKIDNIEVMKILLEKLFNQGSLECILQLDITLLNKLSPLDLILILNILIKLKNKKLIIDLFEQVNIDPNTMDKNNDYPLITAYSIVNENNNSKTLEIFNIILDHGARTDIGDINHIPLLYLSLNNGSYTVLRCLFKRNIPIYSIVEPNNNSLLIRAMEKNDIETIKSLLRSNDNTTDNFNIISNDNNNFSQHLSPLTIAYCMNNEEIFNFLLIHSNIHLLDKYGYNILHYAIMKEDEKLVKDLVQKGIDVNYQKNQDFKGHSALEIAIHLKNRELFLILLSSRTLRINDLNKNKQPLLLMIINMKNYSFEEKLQWMEDLLKHGANVNIYDLKGQSLLFYAIKEKSHPMIKLFMEYGANTNLPKDKNNHTSSLMKYTLNNEPLNVIECLIKYGHSNCLEDKDIIKIVKEGRFDLIKLLIPQYIHINRKYDGNNSLLYYAVNYEQETIANYLIDHGIDYHQSEEQIINLLRFGNNISMLKLLIPRVIDINSSFNDGLPDDPPEVILSYAIESQNIPFIQYLIQCQPDFGLLDHKVEFIEDILDILENEEHLTTTLPYIIRNPSLHKILLEIMEEDRIDLLDILIQHQLDINYIDQEEKTLLIYAIEKRKIQWVQYLLERKANVSVLFPNLLKEIMVVGQWDVLKYLLTHETMNIHFEENYGQLLYRISYSTESKDIIEQLRYYGIQDISINYDNEIEIKDTILTKSSLELLKFFFPYYKEHVHRDEKERNSEYYLPLLYAIYSEKSDIIYYLMENEYQGKEIKGLILDIDLVRKIIHLQISDLLSLIYQNTLKIKQRDKEGNSMLNYAIIQGDEVLAEYLIQEGADLNEKNSSGEVPLTLAIKQGKVAIVRSLINHGLNWNLMSSFDLSLHELNKKYNKDQKVYMEIKELLDQSLENETPDSLLTYALQFQNEPLLKKLFEDNSVASIQTINNHIRLIQSLIKNNNLDLLKYLVQLHLDVNAKDDQGMVPLIYALQFENEAIVQYLLENGALVSSIINIIIEPELFIKIVQMAQNEKLKPYSHSLLDIIFNNTVQGNSKDSNYDPILCYAILHGNEQLVQYLIDHGADVNAFSRSYRNPLLLAIKIQKEDIVRCLVKSEAKLDRNGFITTPLLEAINSNNDSIIRYLIECGVDVNERGVQVHDDTPLVAAVKNNNEKVVHWLIEFGAIIDNEDNYNETPLVLAVRNQNETLVKYLIACGADVNFHSSFHNTPLLEAVEIGNEPLVKYFLERGAQVNVSNEFGDTALIRTIENNREDLAKLLIAYGADVNYETHKNPLTEAAHNNNMNLIRYLIDNGVDVHQTNSDPLIWAIKCKNETMLKYLIYHGVNINQLGDHQQLPLIVAIDENQESMIEYLIEHGAEINPKKDDPLFEETPLIHAIKSHPRHERIIRCLLEHEADANQMNQYGDLPLNCAILTEDETLVQLLINYGADEGIIRLLIQQGADVNQCIENGLNPLFYAIDEKNQPLVHYLLNQGADLHFNSEQEGTALSHAIRSDEKSLIQYLIEQGANVHQLVKIDHRNGSPLVIAIHKGSSIDIIQCLLDRGADIHGDDGELIPLNEAVLHGNEAMVTYLIEHGADVNLMDEEGMTPLILSIKTKKESILTILINHGAKVNQPDSKGNTPLLHTIELSNPQTHNNRYPHEWRSTSFNHDQGFNSPEEDSLSLERKQEKMINSLITHGADIQKKGFGPEDIPIMKAILYNRPSIITTLIRHGVNGNLYDEILGHTPLTWAIENKAVEAVQCLIEEGVNINQYTPKHKRTPLMYVITLPLTNKKIIPTTAAISTFTKEEEEEEAEKEAEKKSQLLKLLLDHGADVNAVDDQGQTALILAMIIAKEKEGSIREEMIQSLIDYGADLHMKDNQGLSAFDYEQAIPNT